MQKVTVEELYDQLISPQIKVFLGEKGVSQSEASHKAEIIKEKVKEPEALLETVTPYKQMLSHDGEQVELIKSVRCELDVVEKALKEDGTLYAASAWLREGVKAKAAALDLVNDLDALKFSLDPEVPKREDYPITPQNKYLPIPSITEDQVKAEWDIAKLAEFLALDANVTHLGKKLHKGGWLFEFRRKLFTLEPTVAKEYKSGVGVKTYFATNTATYTREEVDALFLKLQEEYRSDQQKLNYLKAQLKDETSKRASEAVSKWRSENNAAQSEYQKKHGEWTAEVQRINSEWNDTQAELESRRIELRKYISKLKIVVPVALADLINTK